MYTPSISFFFCNILLHFFFKRGFLYICTRTKKDLNSFLYLQECYPLDVLQLRQKNDKVCVFLVLLVTFFIINVANEQRKNSIAAMLLVVVTIMEIVVELLITIMTMKVMYWIPALYQTEKQACTLLHGSC